MKIVRRKKASSEQLAHITQEMYKQNLELAERNKTLSLLRSIDEVVLSSAASAQEIAQIIANLLTTESDFNLAVIYVANEERTHINAHGISTNAKDSNAASLLEKSLKSVPVPHRGKSAFAHAITSRKAQLVSGYTHLSKEIDDKKNSELKEKLNTGSIFVCSLQAGSRPIGALVLGLPASKSEVSEFQHNLVDRLASTISIAVENHLLYEELQKVTSRLRVQNSKLRALDEAKDEFISMASHQLRTPLTTVKGYLSMVLEGDTGKIKNDQKDLLQRAFDGADRMVYLIADLLNVSRLQSGKFVIENKPTDLVKLISVEVDQLQESAANHQLKLTFHKPNKFPAQLMIDETKIRQVIMNFLDNAIYYTPKGGRVDVALEATDKAINYTVKDSGLGVPKAEQHHLFAKFYRAGNARKMRPDGTGLGLFMAKKVIIAQGGAVIFSSTEGRGSTFGFTFPKHALQAKK